MATASMFASPFAESRPRVRRTNEELTEEMNRLRAEIVRLRAGEEPLEVGQRMTTGGHLLWLLGESPAEMRARLAADLLAARQAADSCFASDHVRALRRSRRRTEQLERRLQHAQREAQRMAEVSNGAGRGVALSLSWLLAEHDVVPVAL
ncbi:hypothetical protein ACFWRZ_08975 [Streptomyces rubiginosohelvolus]|uniref:hypothetical protein n=1 Tax=Streptomyces rubiginosohelvolus TaxID=67362 RepID=UPI00365FF5FF